MELHYFRFVQIVSKKKKNLFHSIHLARIKSSVLPTGANEYVGNMLDVSSVSVHNFAHRVIDHRHRHFLQSRRQWALWELRFDRYIFVQIKSRELNLLKRCDDATIYRRKVDPSQWRKRYDQRKFRHHRANKWVERLVEMAIEARRISTTQDRIRRCEDRIAGDLPRFELFFLDTRKARLRLQDRVRRSLTINR